MMYMKSSSACDLKKSSIWKQESGLSLALDIESHFQGFYSNEKPNTTSNPILPSELSHLLVINIAIVKHISIDN